MNNYMIYNYGIVIVRIVFVLAVGIQDPCFLLNKILISSCKYHCLSGDNPGGTITSGSSLYDECQDGLLNILISLSRSLLDFLTNTESGELYVNLKCYICLIPLSAVFIVCFSKCALQL